MHSISNHIVNIGQKSFLEVEPDLATRRLFDVLATETPVLLEQTVRVRLDEARAASGQDRITTSGQAPEASTIRRAVAGIRDGIDTMSKSVGNADTAKAAELWAQSFERLDVSSDAAVVERVNTGPNLDAAGLQRFAAWGFDNITTLVDARAATARREARRDAALAVAALLTTLGLAVAIARSIRRPMRGLLRSIGQLRDGDLDVRVRPAGPDELATVAEFVNQTAQRLGDADQRIARAVTRDTLTGLPNTAESARLLSVAIAQQRVGEIVAVSVVDLGDLEVVNDRFGSRNGDKVLHLVAERLRVAARPGAVVSRIGAEQFAVLHTALPSIDAASAESARLLDEVRRPFVLADQPGHIELDTAVGALAVRVPDQSLNAEQLLDDADTAVRTAKSRADGQICLFDAEIRKESRRLAELRSEMRMATSSPRGTGFYLQYGPILSCRTGELNGFATVLRWWHPRFGEIASAEFLPFAQQSGAVSSLGRFVLEEACARVAAWRANDPELFVTIPVEQDQLSDPSFVDDVLQVIEEFALPGSALMLEMPASVLVDAPSTVLDRLVALRVRGVRVVLSGLGSAFNTLDGVEEVSPAALALDPRLVASVTHDVDRAPNIMVAAAIELAHRLGLEASAPGVSTATQLEVMHQLGCNTFSGPIAGGWIEADDCGRYLAPPAADAAPAAAAPVQVEPAIVDPAELHAEAHDEAGADAVTEPTFELAAHGLILQGVDAGQLDEGWATRPS